MPKALVIGSPIAHSLSPVLHSAGYAAAGLETWTYDRAEVTAAAFDAFMDGLSADVAGLSVTMPCKEAALAYADHASALARQVGAANTLYRAPDGWHADNTDVAGVVNALLGAGLDHAESAVILGSGATARSCVAAASKLGVTRMTFAVRHDAREETLRLARSYDMQVDVVRFDNVGSAVEQADLTMSTLPANAADVIARDVELLELDGAYLFDVVYAQWPSLLAQAASDAGAITVSGLEMLIEQAAVQFELFTGVSAPIADMRSAGYAAMK